MARRTVPVNGAHHSSWTSGSGISAGRPMGEPGGSATRTSATSGTPHRAASPPAAARAARRQREVERPIGGGAHGPAESLDDRRRHAPEWPAPLTGHYWPPSAVGRARKRLGHAPGTRRRVERPSRVSCRSNPAGFWPNYHHGTVRRHSDTHEATHQTESIPSHARAGTKSAAGSRLRPGIAPNSPSMGIRHEDGATGPCHVHLGTSRAAGPRSHGPPSAMPTTSPSSVPLAWIVPAGSSSTPCGAAHERHHPDPRPQAGSWPHDRADPSGPGLPRKTASIGEAHEEHVDAVRRRGATGRGPAAAAAAHQAHEPRPERARRSRGRSRAGSRGSRFRAATGARLLGPRAPGYGMTLEPPRFSMIRMMAGPRMTMNSDGKMQPTSGNSILIGALAACSSARWRRSMRSCSDWTWSTLQIETPSCSAWMIAPMKLVSGGTSVRGDDVAQRVARAPCRRGPRRAPAGTRRRAGPSSSRRPCPARHRSRGRRGRRSSAGRGRPGSAGGCAFWRALTRRPSQNSGRDVADAQARRGRAAGPATMLPAEDAEQQEQDAGDDAGDDDLEAQQVRPACRRGCRPWRGASRSAR